MDRNISHGAVENITAAIQNLTLVLKERGQNDQTFLGQVTAVQNATKAIVRLSSGEIKCIIPKQAITPHFCTSLEGLLRTQVDINAADPNQEGTYTSPQKLASILVRENEWVKNLWANQFKIHWNTYDGYPDPFSFYGFCREFGLAESELTYQLRREHVMTRLWREQEKLKEICECDRREFCPPVYVKNGVTWQKWNWNNDETNLVNEGDGSIEWITNDGLKEYITTNSVENVDLEAQNQLYWAVFEEDDFVNDNPHGEDFPGRTQVYVGRSENGITGRWLGTGGSHCVKMLGACKRICKKDSYDLTFLCPRDFQLVDLRLLLHKASHEDGSNSGLFIMGTFTDKEDLKNAERINIQGKRIDNPESPIIPSTPEWNPKNMKYGMNGI